MNKKKVIIISLTLTLILLVVARLYQTFALDTIITDNNNDTYNIVLTGSTSQVTLPALSSKTIIYKIKNTNNGTVAYGVGYTASSGIKVKKWYDSLDDVSGLIEKDEYKFIKLKISNYNNNTEEVQISTILGYETGGDLIVPESTILVSEALNEKNYIKNDGNTGSTATSSFLGSAIKRGEIESVEIVDDNIPYSNSIESINVSQDGTDSIKMWYTYGDTDGLYKVYIGSNNGIVSFPSKSSYFFRNVANATSIDLKYSDTLSVTTMEQMFFYCSKLANVDISYFNTSKVTDMSSLFHSCSNLTTVDLSSFDTSNVASMSNLFYGCKQLSNINLSNFNTSKVTSMKSMFDGCSSLTSLDLSNFNTSKVTSMKLMFNGCSSLTSLDLRNFDTSNVTTMESMFQGCSKLTSLDLLNFNTLKVTSMKEMFSGCSNLTVLDLSNFNPDNLVNIDSMFYDDRKLKELYLNNIDFSGVTAYTDLLFRISSANVTIVVKDATQQNILKNDFGYSTYNILTVDEYNAL